MTQTGNLPDNRVLAFIQQPLDPSQPHRVLFLTPGLCPLYHVGQVHAFGPVETIHQTAS